MRNIICGTGFLLFIFVSFVHSAFSAQVDTVRVYSVSMKKELKTVVILPDAYGEKQNFPVVYLLHGYGGNYASWVNRVPEIKALADQYSMIVVCPDGGKGSWYWDSPIDSTFRYETFVAQELVQWVDGNYKTDRSRGARAITGLSMGGHGALYLAIKHQAVFGAAGSLSGGVDIRPFPENWDMKKRLGSYEKNTERWDAYTVANMLSLLEPNVLDLIIDCGTSDTFYQVNLNLHKDLLARKIDHTYISRPGGHNWPYWQNSIQYQLLFMHRFFEKNKVELN